MTPEPELTQEIMELSAAFPDSARLSAAVAFTSGYASALADQRNHADAPQLEKFEEQFLAMIESCKDVVKKVPRNFDGPIEAVRNRLVLATLIVEGLKLMVAVRPSFLEKNPEAKAFWTDDVQELIEETAELFDDFAETLALGLSSGFREEIDSARKEAGIDDAKSGRPARGDN
jgi:hypothetical protein